MSLGSLFKREGMIQYGLDRSGPDLLQPPLEVFPVSGHCANQFLLLEENAPHIEGGFGIRCKAEYDYG